MKDVTMDNLKCDRKGVPLLVQNIRYRSFDMTFTVLFFDGSVCNFTTDYICSQVGLMQNEATSMQYLQAENTINELVKADWTMWSKP